MEKEFVSYEIALALKKVGFDEPCFGFYKSDKLEFQDFFSQNKKRTNSWYTSLNGCTAPTFSQVFKFFREKYGLEGFVTPLFRAKLNISFEERKYDANIVNGTERFYKKGFATHKEAELECLKKLIEIVKDGKK